MQNTPGASLSSSQQSRSPAVQVQPGALDAVAAGRQGVEMPAPQPLPSQVLPAQVQPQLVAQAPAQASTQSSSSTFSSPSMGPRLTQPRHGRDAPEPEPDVRPDREDKRTPGTPSTPVRTAVKDALNNPLLRTVLMERVVKSLPPDHLQTPLRRSSLPGAPSEKKRPSTTKVPRHVGLNPPVRVVVQDHLAQPGPPVEPLIPAPVPGPNPEAHTPVREIRIDIPPHPGRLVVDFPVLNGHPAGIHASTLGPNLPPPALTWQELCARHAGHEGAAIRANHQVRYGPSARFAALDALFTVAQEATERSDNNPLPLPRGFLDKLFKAYLSGTTWWGRRLNPDELVQTLTALLELRVRPDKLQATIRNARLSTNARMQAVVNVVYWPGWGLGSYMGAVLLRKGIDPNLSLLLLSFMIATLGEFGVAVVRHGGVGPVHTADMVRQETAEGDRMVRFDSTWEGFFVRGMAFLPFVLTLWYITYSVHDDDPIEQSARRSYMRFILNGVIATPLVGGWLANAGHALGHNQVNFLPRSVDDQHRLAGTMDSLTGTRLLNPRRLTGDVLRGIGGALWSPSDPNAPFLKKLRSSVPQATTRVRWLARFAGVYVLLTLRPILAKAFAHIHPDFGHYIADVLIALAWGFILESGSRTVSTLEPSRQREAQLNARLQTRRHEEMKSRGQEVLAFRVQPQGVAPRRT